MNAVFFNDLFLPTFPMLEVPLLLELRKSISVDYYMFKNDPRFGIEKYNKVYEKLNPKKIDHFRQMKDVFGKNIVYISRFEYGKYFAGKAANMAKSKGSRVFFYDVSGIDSMVRESSGDFFAAKSPWMKEMILRQKFGRKYKNIYVTGTIHFDAVAAACDKKAFFKKYNLDENKKLAILTPANPGEVNSQLGIENLYRKIINVVLRSNPNFQIMIKGHPYDYSYRYDPSQAIIRKTGKYGNKSSWEVFASDLNVIVCDPEDGYDAIKCCDVVLNVRSSLAIEVPMFYKPLININRKKYVTNWAFDKRVMYDVHLSDLPRVLGSNSIWNINKAHFDRYISRYCFSNDGQAYKRIAGRIISVM